MILDCRQTGPRAAAGSGQGGAGTTPALPPIPQTGALFLDFDGTLAEIAPHPDAVRVAPATVAAIRALAGALGGALAIVTGREIAAIDRHLGLPSLAVAGNHGLVRRGADGQVAAPAPDIAALSAIGARLERLAAAAPGLLVERKAFGIALHWRARPEMEAACLDAAAAALAAAPGFALKRGKMVAELTPAGADKGTAIAAYMAAPPFAGRLPIVAGDDVTDEDAFAAVNAQGGLSIKVGAGASRATHRAPDPAAIAAWLAEAAARLTGGRA